jgi:hypothetical protein
VNRIEKYIKSLSKDVYLGPKEMEEFKAEIRNHLLDTVKELQQQGMSEEESTTMALNRFGGEKTINAEIRKVVRFQNKFRNSMLRAAFSFLALSLVLLVCYLFIEQNNTTDFDGMQRQYHSQIAESIKADDSMTEAELATFFNENKRILRHVYISKIEGNSQATQYVYPPNTTKEQLTVQPIVEYSIPMGNSGTQWEVKIALKSEVLFSQTPYVVFIISVMCFVVYWILYGLRNTMNAYRMGRLNVMWVVLFFSLNVVAYVLYKLEEIVKLRRLS